MNNIAAVFKKQLIDTPKNKTILIFFLMLPIMTLIMNNAVKIDGLSENYFVYMFAPMFAAMAPLMSMQAIVSEEKEKNTLRVLLMSNVKPHEYLLGVGGYVWLCCMAGTGIICLAGSFKGREAVAFMAAMGVGLLCSLLIGAAIGTWSSGQMSATSLGLPIMLVFMLLPMLSMFNETIAKFAKFAYSVQLGNILSNLGAYEPAAGSVIIIAANMALALGAFIFAYRKCGLA